MTQVPDATLKKLFLVPPSFKGRGQGVRFLLQSRGSLSAPFRDCQVCDRNKSEKPRSQVSPRRSRPRRVARDRDRLRAARNTQSARYLLSHRRRQTKAARGKRRSRADLLSPKREGSADAEQLRNRASS